jgi:hypothetical protein
MLQDGGGRITLESASLCFLFCLVDNVVVKRFVYIFQIHLLSVEFVWYEVLCNSRCKKRHCETIGSHAVPILIASPTSKQSTIRAVGPELGVA